MHMHSQALKGWPVMVECKLNRGYEVYIWL